MRRTRSQQRLSCNHENTIVAAARFCPHERQAWKRRLDALAVVSHFNDEEPCRIEVQRGFSDNAPDQIEAVVPAGEGEYGLLAILGR
jgi:hypothetical protein